MTTETLLALVAFAVAMCFTPGPNNAMLMVSGLNFGLWPTVPHVLGVGLGFSLMALLTALGIGQAILASPVLHTVLRVASILYLLWLAWRMARAGPIEGGGTRGRPLTFLEAALFQWVNPKGWVTALGAAGAYVSAARPYESAIVIAGVFAVVGLSSASSWAVFGRGLRVVLGRPGHVRAFNVGMPLLLVASLAPIAIETLAAILPDHSFSP